MFKRSVGKEYNIGWILIVYNKEGVSIKSGCGGILEIEDAITINVQLFKKLRDIIFFLQDNNFMSHFKGHFEGAKTFLTP